MTKPVCNLILILSENTDRPITCIQKEEHQSWLATVVYGRAVPAAICRNGNYYAAGQPAGYNQCSGIHPTYFLVLKSYSKWK
jgi:hypothetical protein